jgi:hypothetical protein
VNQGNVDAAARESERIGRLAENVDNKTIKGMTPEDGAAVINWLYTNGKEAKSRRMATASGLVHPEAADAVTPAELAAQTTQQLMNPANMGREGMEQEVDGYKLMKASEMLGDPTKWDINSELSAGAGSVGGEQYVYAKDVSDPATYTRHEFVAPEKAEGGEEEGSNDEDETIPEKADNKDMGLATRDAATGKRWLVRNPRDVAGRDSSANLESFADRFFPEGASLADLTTPPSDMRKLKLQEKALSESVKQWNAEFGLKQRQFEYDQEMDAISGELSAYKEQNEKAWDSANDIRTHLWDVQKNIAARLELPQGHEDVTAEFGKYLIDNNAMEELNQAAKVIAEATGDPMYTQWAAEATKDPGMARLVPAVWPWLAFQLHASA